MNNEIKKFLKRSTIFIILLLIALSVYYAITIQFLETPNSIIWIHEGYQIKEDAAKAIEENKILIVSGSNSHFGISAEMIQNITGIPTVNYGLHGGMKLYHVKRSKDLLQPGDIVILPLEYEYYWHDDKKFFDQQHLDIKYILTYDKKEQESWNSVERVKYQLLQLIDFLQIIKHRFIIPPQKYVSETINEYGDETYYGKFVNLSNRKPIEIEVDTSIRNHDAYDQLTAYINWCKENDITVVATYPSTIYFEEYDGLAYKKFFEEVEQFYFENSVPVLGTPYEYMYDISLFYDTHYHLTVEGKTMRTQQIIDELYELEIVE